MPISQINTNSIANGAVAPADLSTGAPTWDTSGNVGIGTSSPAQKLHVAGSGTFSGSVGVGTTDPVINSAGRTLHIHAPTDQWSLLHTTNGNTGANGNDGTIFGQIGSDGYMFNYESAALIFGTSSTERMRIDSSGNLLVGRTVAAATGAGLWLYNAGSFGRINFGTSTTASDYCVFYNNSGTGVGGISSTTTATTYATSSDYRLKNTITPMTGALAKVAQLKPVTYKWNADGSDGEGFIAHELAEVIPQAVVGEKDAVDAEGNPVYQGIDTSFLVATLTAAIQELKAELDTVKTELAALKGNG